jgi:hypothetical protein
MIQTDSLILLVNSLSPSEKKKFREGKKEKDYTVLFEIIVEAGRTSSKELKEMFCQKRKDANFNATVNYLYKTLLDRLVALRENHDSHYLLLNLILRARVLFEKSLYEEALELLEQVKRKAVRYENHIALLYVSRLELEYLLIMNLPDLSESDLLNKHFQINEILKNIRKINEHSSLYELLKHRILYKGNIRSQKEKEALNDLVISEMSITSSQKDSFEARKLHLLFQSNYLIGVGDYRSGLQSFRELNSLFEHEENSLSGFPFYYISTLEGILYNLRSIKRYDEMQFFIQKLKNIQVTSETLQININALIFLYELFPHLDKGDFHASDQVIQQHNDHLLTKLEQLNLSRRAEISLYRSLVYIGYRKFKEADKTLISEIVRENKIYTLPLYRTIRLVDLIIHYELGNFDFIHFESRSIKRKIPNVDKGYRVEKMMLRLLNKERKFMLQSEREKLWNKLEPELTDIQKDVFEKQLLVSFDFTAWIESQVRRIPLQDVLRSRFQ